MSTHPINELMTDVMSNLNSMVDVNTIVGNPVETPDGTTIIPVSKVGFGFAAGGSEAERVRLEGAGPGAAELCFQRDTGVDGGCHHLPLC